LLAQSELPEKFAKLRFSRFFNPNWRGLQGQPVLCE